MREGSRLRLGGHVQVGPARSLTWSLADGRRGRRWRSIVEGPDGPVAVLLELTPAGRLARLDVGAAAGLLTLHPEPDESMLHGNIVGPGGVRHLAFDWGPGRLLAVEADPFVLALQARGLPAAEHPGLMVGLHLEIAAIDVLGEAGLLDETGAPAEGDRWPLEVDDAHHG